MPEKHSDLETIQRPQPYEPTGSFDMKALPPKSDQLWLNVLVSLLTFLILFMFVLGLTPIATSIGHQENITIANAVKHSINQGIGRTLANPGVQRIVGFAPMALISLVAFLVAQRRAKVTVVKCNIAVYIGLCFVVVGVRGLVLIPLGPIMLVYALLGQQRGEAWSEGFISLSAIGSSGSMWTTALVWLLMQSSRSKKHGD
jgi:hypothetical protein